MISSEKIEEWIREVELRPTSAPVIIRFIANRLADLTTRNEELLNENIALRTERKVDEYENRIANLEYQLDLLKRQLGSEVTLPEFGLPGDPLASTATRLICLLVYNIQGQILRIDLKPTELVSGGTIAQFSKNVQVGDLATRLLVTYLKEELLLVFDSGRTVTIPVTELPLANLDNLSWEQAYLQEPRGVEELVMVVPIARMSLFDYCIQISRRGYVKKIKEPLFESYLANHYIGTGIKLAPDKTCSLVFCHSDDPLILVSQEGFLLQLDVKTLPFTIEETLRLSNTDHLIATFSPDHKSALIFITQSGKALHRDISWIEPKNSAKSRGQPVISKERRSGGVRVVGAATLDASDWGVVLTSSGDLVVYQMGDLCNTGSIFKAQSSGEVLGFAAFP